MASKSRLAKRFVSVARLGLTAAAAVVALALLANPVLAQYGFGFGSRNNMFDSFFGGFSGPRYSAPAERPADFTRAPAPRKLENPPAATVLVLGDSMADWLAYGLEDALGDTPDLAVVRKNRAASGLIHYDTRNEALDWPHVAREAIAATKPKFVVMMLGLNDRQTIHERGPTAGGTPSTPGSATPPPLVPQDSAADAEHGRRSPNAANDAKSKKDSVLNSYEFRTEEWAEAYSKKIDAMIAALRSGGVPVFWVGLPSIRGSKSTSDMLYLNDLYRTRAEKAGITYIDVWDGFVDDNGRFTIHGPDFEGQTRRLRVSDGVHFTKSGARKLAHYLEREIRRVMAPGAEVVALPTSEPQTPAPSATPGAATARPLAGPVLPLTVSYSAAQELLGATDDAPATPTSRRAARVLVKGEAVSPPAGRSDDFKWPRRGIAPFGADPVVATT
ncbi:MAG TPA: SGNH family hydrolase, partial [Thermomicrobiales bacterium]|nr:SGNH family hydrolase [Thermomicrobiales bacterium]